MGLFCGVEHDISNQFERSAPDGGKHQGGADVARDLATHIVPAVLAKQVAHFTLIPRVVGSARAERTLQAVIALEPLGI